MSKKKKRIDGDVSRCPATAMTNDIRFDISFGHNQTLFVVGWDHEDLAVRLEMLHSKFM